VCFYRKRLISNSDKENRDQSKSDRRFGSDMILKGRKYFGTIIYSERFAYARLIVDDKSNSILKPM
jgi:hypothetical protein